MQVARVERASGKPGGILSALCMPFHHTCLHSLCISHPGLGPASATLRPLLGRGLCSHHIKAGENTSLPPWYYLILALTKVVVDVLVLVGGITFATTFVPPFH